MLSPDRKRVFVFAALMALAASSAGWKPAVGLVGGSEAPRGLEVDFIALGEDGAPVADLQASEVEVRLNGKVRKVQSIRRVAVKAAAPAVGSKVPPPYGTNAGMGAGRNIVLIVDQESFIGGREQPLRNAVEGLLEELTPSDRTMVVALPYGGVRVPFTADKAPIRMAVDGLTGQGARGESGSDLACRTRRFLETLDGFLDAQAGRRAPLTVIVFTAGLAAPRRDAPMTRGPGACEVLVNHFQVITTAAGAARARFYMMQPADIGMGSRDWRESIGGIDNLGSDNPMEGIENLAGATGAVRLPLDATGTESLLRVAKETSAYFVAEVEPERNEIYGRSRPVSVRVNRSGITVRCRPEITFAEGAGAKKPGVGDLLTSADSFTDLPLRASGFTVREASGQLRVGVLVEPVEAGVSLVSAGAILVDGSGKVAASWLAKDAGARPLLGAMAVKEGTYRLRVAAIDKAGRTGLVEDNVEARLATVGPLSLGSLMLGVSRGEGMQLQLEFGTEPTAIASFDMYGGLAGMGLTATLELAREVEGPAMAVLPLSLSRADENRVVATGAVPIGSLPPGDYVVRGVIQLQDGKTARVMRTLRKIAP